MGTKTAIDIEETESHYQGIVVSSIRKPGLQPQRYTNSPVSLIAQMLQMGINANFPSFQ